MSVIQTDFSLPGLEKKYTGKVRDAYFLRDGRVAMVATDRISAFDVVLPRPIPGKGRVLNMLAAHFLDACADIVPVWKLATPDPLATVGLTCEPLRVEVIVRGYLAGSAWRAYAAGARGICGVPLPDGLRENERLPEPIITPTTKADEGHDLDISADEIIATGLVPGPVWRQVERTALLLFARGQEMAAARGLILVDTKYEFGMRDGSLYLIDEIHTPDSSRYFHADTYAECLASGRPQRQLSKEFVRQWLLDRGFSGQPGQEVPEMTDDFIRSVSARYAELYTRLTGLELPVADERTDTPDRVEENILEWLARNPA